MTTLDTGLAARLAPEEEREDDTLSPEIVDEGSAVPEGVPVTIVTEETEEEAGISLTTVLVGVD